MLTLIGVVADDPPHQVRRPAGASGAVTTIEDFLELVGQLEDVQLTEYSRYTKLEVSARTFGYLWQPTRTVGLKQTLAEQAARVCWGSVPRSSRCSSPRAASAGWWCTSTTWSATSSRS